MTGAPGREPHWADGLTLAALPAEAARRFGDREALRFRNRRYSFRQIAAEVDRLAAGFVHLGIEAGERAGLWLNNCIPRIPTDCG